MANRVTGLENVLSNLNERIEDIQGRSMDGLMEAGLNIQRASQKLAPVDTGNLKGSAYTREAQAGGTAVEIGYTANYALFVHENLEAMHTNGTAKFLEKALRNNEDEIVEIVRQRAEVE